MSHSILGQISPVRNEELAELSFFAGQKIRVRSQIESADLRAIVIATLPQKKGLQCGGRESTLSSS